MQLRPKIWKHTLDQLGVMTRRCGNPDCGKTALSNVLRRSESYLLNRSDWLCSPACLESTLAKEFACAGPHSTRALAHFRMPLGLLLLQRGAIEDQQLRNAIALQKETRQRIGACLCSIGATTESAVASGLSAQWACALFPTHSIQRGCASLIPAALLRAHEMLPVHFTAASRSLYIAFARGVDYAALYAIEQMLDCHTEPCIVPDRVIFDEIENRNLACENERALRHPGSASETAHIVTCYARQCGADEVRYVAFGEDLWTRVIGHRRFMDITFQA